MAEVTRPYVLRYWETEFPSGTRGEGEGRTRLTRRAIHQIIARIRQLLLRRGLPTAAGAKKRLDMEILEGRFDDSGRCPRRRSTGPRR
jgi:hypothetical protein